MRTASGSQNLLDEGALTSTADLAQSLAGQQLNAVMEVCLDHAEAAVPPNKAAMHDVFVCHIHLSIIYHLQYTMLLQKYNV